MVRCGAICTFFLYFVRAGTLCIFRCVLIVPVRLALETGSCCCRSHFSVGSSRVSVRSAAAASSASIEEFTWNGPSVCTLNLTLMKCACFCLFSIWLAAELNWNSLASINFKASWPQSAWRSARAVCPVPVTSVLIVCLYDFSKGSPTWLSSGQVAVALCSVFVPCVSLNHSTSCFLIASLNRLIVRITFKLRSCLTDSFVCNLFFNPLRLSLCHDVRFIS